MLPPITTARSPERTSLINPPQCLVDRYMQARDAGGRRTEKCPVREARWEMPRRRRTAILQTNVLPSREGCVVMPKVTENPDGTRTWSIDSTELSGLRSLLAD